VKRLLLWGPAVVQMALIFMASSVPGDQVPGTISDKLAHLLVYAVLGACFMLPLAGGRLVEMTATKGVGAVLLALAYGISDEIHQSFTPGRSPDVMDVVADTIGAGIGVAAVVLVASVASRFLSARRK